jgi:hypothetical protein
MASSSGSSSRGAPDPLQAALDAAKQLSSIWKTGPHAKLLRRPPPAAWEGRAAEAWDETILLLNALLDSTSEVLARDPMEAADTKGLIDNWEKHQLAGLLARLVVWLQQGPEVRLEQNVASSSSSSNSSRSSLLLWDLCTECLGKMFEVCANDETLDIMPGSPPPQLLQHLENMTLALDEAGTEELQQC